jgi:hypothetical protein
LGPHAAGSRLLGPENAPDGAAPAHQGSPKGSVDFRAARAAIRAALRKRTSVGWTRPAAAGPAGLRLARARRLRWSIRSRRSWPRMCRWSAGAAELQGYVASAGRLGDG